MNNEQKRNGTYLFRLSKIQNQFQIVEETSFIQFFIDDFWKNDQFGSIPWETAPVHRPQH